MEKIFSEQLPEAFLERMKEMLDGKEDDENSKSECPESEYSEFMNSYDKERHAALRVNPLKMSAEQFQATNETAETEGAESFHLSRVPWEPNGFYYRPQDGDRPGRHPYHEAGVYYIQEPSAMAPAALAQICPGERVLDLCAAPGGKSTQAAAALSGEGLLVSNEINAARARILSQNIERMGIANAIVLNETPQHLAECFPAFFDKIIIDAPCSGEGMFRKEEQAVLQWSPENVKQCAVRQREILEAAASMLADGGTMIYSTCTFAPQENEETIACFLGKHPEFKVENLAQILGYDEMNRCGFETGRADWIREEAVRESCRDVQTSNAGYRDQNAENFAEQEINQRIKECMKAVSGTIRLWPHKLCGEGHFAARLVKSGEKMRRKPSGRCRADASAIRLWETFCKENLTKEGIKRFKRRAGAYQQFGSELYSMPVDMNLSGLRVLRPGLHLGTIKKDRFEPGHALAKTLWPEDVKRTVSLRADDPRVLSWLCGDALQMEAEKGWTLVCTDGFALGWGKAGGRINNHYPKGLRIQM